ncbi:PoNe immunity protein domain-containing protein [Leptothrix sp. BB-4]
MIRAPMGDRGYWEKAVKNGWNSISMAEEQIKKPAGAPTYRAEYLWGLTQDHPRQTLTQYSRGDAIAVLYNPFPKVLDAWELSNREAEFIERAYNPGHIRAWEFRLDYLEHYNWCFWLVGLALVFDIPDDQWQRLNALIGGEGEDELLDRIMATRQPNRRIGDKLLHKKPYARLLKAVNAKPELQAALLKDFVDNWYKELKRPFGKRIWWYDYGDPEINPMEKGSYFGRWCVEAVAAVKAFGLDDSLCLGHEHYPGDLLRPNGPSTHANRYGWKAWLSKQFTGKES